MIDNSHQPTGWWLLAAAVLTLSGCASLGSREASETASGQASEDPTVFGVAGDRFVAIDPATGFATEIVPSLDLWDVEAMTYDPASRTFYAAADSNEEPRLVAIDRDTGQSRRIGLIDLSNRNLTRIEGLAFDPTDGILYATGGKSKWASDLLLTIDVETGQATTVGRIAGTLQGEIDALVAIGGKLFGVDVAVHEGTLYRIDKHSGNASPEPLSFPRAITDLAFDPDTRSLLAIAEDARLLLAMTLPDGEVTELGPTHEEVELGGRQITALACVTESAGLFEDDFESGDLSLWIQGTEPE